MSNVGCGSGCRLTPLISNLLVIIRKANTFYLWALIRKRDMN